MQKIDFFGGLHGNFLELVVNVAINQTGYDISKPQFTPDGACHLKNYDDSYAKMIVAHHYSFFKLPFKKNDVVIRIVPTTDDVLIGITNSFLRAGDQKVDIDNLEKNTINKLEELSRLKKTVDFKNTIIKDYGVKTDYPRAGIRNYFYSMLHDYENGLGMFTDFNPSPSNVHHFPFRAFFDIGQFYSELNNVAKFLELNFYPMSDLAKLHSDFIKYNQGYHSELKCKEIWQAILHGNSMDIKLNLIEEAWINHQVAKCFRCYDLPLLMQDQYPTNTLEISQAVYEWKSQDYQTISNN
jgi:hypothetical protein